MFEILLLLYDEYYSINHSTESGKNSNIHGTLFYRAFKAKSNFLNLFIQQQQQKKNQFLIQLS